VCSTCSVGPCQAVEKSRRFRPPRRRVGRCGVPPRPARAPGMPYFHNFTSHWPTPAGRAPSASRARRGAVLRLRCQSAEIGRNSGPPAVFPSFSCQRPRRAFPRRSGVDMPVHSPPGAAQTRLGVGNALRRASSLAAVRPPLLCFRGAAHVPLLHPPVAAAGRTASRRAWVAPLVDTSPARRRGAACRARTRPLPSSPHVHDNLHHTGN